MGKKIAVFDFDGTLYPFETFTFLIKQLKKQKGFQSRYYSFNLQFFTTYAKYKLKLMPKFMMREKALKTFVRLFKGLTEKEIYSFFEYAYADMKDRVNNNVLEELHKLKEQGYVIVLVSGAVKPLLEIVGRDIPFDIVIGSEIPITSGRFDEQKEIVYIQGNKKVKELESALDKYLPDERGTEVEVNWNDSAAYADSQSDLPVLELVGNPVCVSPEPKLRVIAEERKWRILEPNC
ncbi:HAD family hydrolase [Desulfuribacillus alkaliarsenatis]|uniref:Uncharacterized protein n=1 Tax=Desulfuribacillus alkaliarsenatis TaxID=766136 RepID=A0A1E5G5H6_9FIRM|nr:HAD-IB family hydrolase [Desulfuribacillus alkaliarsenatis]OEF98413.1 hypothetical protein BHF68_01675 [Desulfuribacillus alkaliarsenatis]